MPLPCTGTLKRPLASLWLPVSLLFLTLCTDQFTKMAARKLLTPANEIPILGGMVKFSLVENYEGFLGIVAGLPPSVQFLFLYVAVTLLLLCCLAYLFFLSKKNSRYDIPLGILTGGGLSNLLDRLLHDGGVTDFLIITVGGMHTGIFNLADVYILFGSFRVGFTFYFRPDR